MSYVCVMRRAFFQASVYARRRRFHTTEATVATDLRTRLMDEVKTAMKSKDIVTSTTIRSVLSEVYAADKTSEAKIPPASIANILRKAVIRRTDAASKFTEASRFDLAEKENLEAELLSKFLPPLLSEAEIDKVLGEVIQALPAGSDPRKLLGQVFKNFYSKVDKSLVDTSIVKDRAEKLLTLVSR